jgi:hypothetical protein
MKPRVLFLDHKASVGGSELSLLDIARDNLGTSRVVLLADGPFRQRLEEAGIEVEVLPAPAAVSGISREGGLGRDLLALPHVLGLARRVAKLSRRYELIYTNSQKALIIGALAGVIARKPVIWHQRALLTRQAQATHNNYFSGAHQRLAALSSNLLIKRIIANSRATAEALVEAGVRANRVRVVHNGIDPSPFEAVAATEVDDLRRELGLEGVSIVGAFGRLTPWKGQHVLLEALPGRRSDAARSSLREGFTPAEQGPGVGGSGAFRRISPRHSSVDAPLGCSGAHFGRPRAFRPGDCGGYAGTPPGRGHPGGRGAGDHRR